MGVSTLRKTFNIRPSHMLKTLQWLSAPVYELTVCMRQCLSLVEIDSSTMIMSV